MDVQLKMLIEGDHIVFGDVFRQYFLRTFHFFRKRTGSGEQAADLTQQCFLRLWQYHASLSKDHSIEQQLYVIARSLLLNHLEKETNWKKTKLTISQLNEPYVFSQQEAESRDMVRVAFNTLPPAEKSVIHLKHFRQYSNKEISGALSISIKTVEARISRAYKHLKNILTFL